MKKALLSDRRYFGKFGGAFTAETLMPLLIELEEAFSEFVKDKNQKKELEKYLKLYAGRPTPLYLAVNISKELGFKVFLKREDLLHTGAHKINNALGQMLLAKKMGKKLIIAETGAGQHGVAVATVAACLGMECRIFMGAEDVRRQAPNVKRMKLLGAEVIPVESGSRTLKDAINEALRFWVENADRAFYLIGSVVGPHPYPTVVRYFQSVIGRETKQQFRRISGNLPDCIIACVGGGSNAAGIFSAFIKNTSVRLIGVEAGGSIRTSGLSAASISEGSEGIFQGCLSLVLQDKDGNIREAHSVAAGLDYPGVGPEHAYWKSTGRAEYVKVYDEEALEAFEWLSRKEGIIPALESAHAIAYLRKLEGVSNAVVCLSGRGDKDLDEYFRLVKGR